MDGDIYEMVRLVSLTCAANLIAFRLEGGSLAVSVLNQIGKPLGYLAHLLPCPM